MDITNINNVYTDMANLQTQGVNLEKMKADYKKLGKGTDEEELMKACKQFEAYFTEQMYKAMWKSIPEAEYSSNSSRSSMEYYRDNFIKEIADMTAESGEIGLAQMLFDNMKQSLNALSIQEVKEKMAADKAGSEKTEEAKEDTIEEVSMGDE